MARLFIRPSQVVERLRDRYAFIKTKHPTFPALVIKAVSDSKVQEELADSDNMTSGTATLYVSSGLSTGSLITSAGMSPTEITHGLSIGLVIATSDEHSQYSDELQTLIKEFILLALHGWQFNAGNTPLTFNNEGLFRVKGRALLFRTYDFSHTVEIQYEDLDDTWGLFDALDDFLEERAEINAFTNPSGDIATINANIDLPAPE
jgi:hypothetical protein